MKKLPKLIYVTLRSPEASGEYLEADATPGGKEDGDKVGIYELKEIKIQRITHSLEKPKRK